MKTASTKTLVSLACMLCAVSVARADVTGTVGADGRPLAGALVTAKAANGIETSVYSAADGSFRLANLPAGPYSIRARAPGFEDVSADAKDGDRVSLDAKPAADPLLHAPSSTFLSLLPDGEMRRRFIVNCGTCHEISHTRIWKDGAVRDVAKWAEAITLMRSIDVYALVPPALGTQQYAEWLATNLSPQRLATLKPPAAADPATVGRAVITEYPLPQADELPHDVAIGPDGRIWITAFWHSEMWALDPKTGAVDRYPVATDTSTPAQVRALQFDRHGRLWIILGGTKSVVRLDPKTREFRTYPVDMYAHDLVLDSKGDVWFNDYFSKPERIGKLEAATGKVTYYPLPSSNLSEAEGKPLPYGLEIDAQDRLWSTQLTGNTLVRFDTRTKQAKLYVMPEPNSGPRRNAIGKDGSVWVPEFNLGYLDRFDPRTEKFERYFLGDASVGAYDVAVDPRSGVVWITGALGSSLLRFDPKTKTVERYPLPTEPAYMRHVAIDPHDGSVWSAYSSLPTVVPKVVRLVRGR